MWTIARMQISTPVVLQSDPVDVDLSRRVAARYLCAQDEAAFEALADHWADVFLDEFVEHLHIDAAHVNAALQAGGVTADQVNALTDTRQAGLGEWIRALGGKILKSTWHMLVGPFVAIKKLIFSQQFRTEIKISFRRALDHEARSTRHMVEVAGRLARGEDVPAPERKTAMIQLVDILTKIVFAYLAGPHVVDMFSGGIWKALAAVLSPLDEVAIMLFDKPLRAASRKLLGADIGMLPSGFYTHFA